MRRPKNTNGYKPKRRRKRWRKKKLHTPVIKKRRTDVADALKDAATSYGLGLGYSCFTELGLSSWGKLRADVICVNLKQRVLMFEVKSSSADYKNDTKWREYLPFADRFYFLLTEATYSKIKKRIKADVAGTTAGVMVLDDETGFVRIVIRCTQQDIDPEIRSALICRMAWRNGTSKRNSRRKRQFVEEDGPT